MTKLEKSHDNVTANKADLSATGADNEMNVALQSPNPQSGIERDQQTDVSGLNAIDLFGQKRAIIYIRVSTKAQAERDGNPEGYSLPTQRTACLLRAEQLGAVVVDEYIDKDSGTRVDKRPAMLALIERVTQNRDVDFVIVHQLSRFARRRRDDAVVTEDLEEAGAQLVSCVEGIDQTTAGRMLQGMLAVVNEYQSRNMSDDIKRKTLQKVKDGGTPSLAPIGYRNVQGADADKNKRWVELDPDRVCHIKWAFETYAAGKHSLKQLAEALELRGLLQRATKGRPERPLTTSMLHAILRNRYYTGIVTFKGIDYEGKHPQLVDLVTFEQVQRVLEAHRHSGERAHRHTHYLKGSLRCYRCKSRLAYCVSTGNGGAYAYFFCLGRHHGRTECDLPHLNPDDVETAIANYYGSDQLQSEHLLELRKGLLEDLAGAEKRTESERKRLIARITTVRHTRYQWAERAMAGVVPDDIAREKQLQLGAQLAQAETDLARLDRITNETRSDINQLIDLARDAAGSYRGSPDDLRREWNFALYEALEIDVEDWQPVVAGSQRTPIFEAVHTARVPRIGPPLGKTRPRRSSEASVLSLINGSTVATLVEVTGLEPATSTMRT